MIEKLPYYYRKSKIVEELYTTVQKVLDKISDDIYDKDLSLFITTTTDFTSHEKDVGLTAITADNETKRAGVIARIQGNNVLTKSALYELIDIYDKTGCTITEDFANYTVTIAFTGRKGKPYNFEQMQSAVEEVKPAHIKIDYVFEKNGIPYARLRCANCGEYYIRNTVGKNKRYKVWVRGRKKRKGCRICGAKDIREDTLKVISAEVLGLDEFDENVFSRNIECIEIDKNILRFGFYDGTVKEMEGI